MFILYTGRKVVKGKLLRAGMRSLGEGAARRCDSQGCHKRTCVKQIRNWVGVSFARHECSQVQSFPQKRETSTDAFLYANPSRNRQDLHYKKKA
jgi:hypothetical protein